MSAEIDVLGIGAVAVDDLYYLEEFPQPDEKVRVVASERQAGGLAGTALVAAARLGCSAAYAGTLGEDEQSRYILDGLRAEGVSTEWVVHRAGARPYRSAIIVDMRTKSRTILSCEEGVVGAADQLPEEAILLSSRVLFVDHSGLPGMLRAARIARRAGIPVVGDFERRYPEPFEELLALTDHLVLPVEFARQLTGAGDGRSAAEAIRDWDRSREAVVVTMGAEGCWYVSVELPGAARHQPAFRVRTVDTTGCGDVFHGAYAAGLARGLGLAERVRLASAAAAIKATRPGGQKGIPTSAEVEAFLASAAR
jgi:sugar/nucleoside kinase (ribokinase family)